MRLYRGAWTRVKVGTHLSEEFEANVGVVVVVVVVNYIKHQNRAHTSVHQGTVLSPLLFSIVMDVVWNKMEAGMLQEIL